MFAALKRFFGKSGPATVGEEASKGVAKSRLHFVLVQDRTGLTSEEMAEFKQELINVINRFFEINRDALDVSYKRDTGMTTLLINSPVLVRRRQSPEEPASPKKRSSGTGASAAKTKPEASKTVIVKEVISEAMVTSEIVAGESAPVGQSDPIQRSRKAVGEDLVVDETTTSLVQDVVAATPEIKAGASKGSV